MNSNLQTKKTLLSIAIVILSLVWPSAPLNALNVGIPNTSTTSPIPLNNNSGSTANVRRSATTTPYNYNDTQTNAGVYTEYHTVTGSTTPPTTFYCSNGGFVSSPPTQVSGTSGTSTAFTYQCIVPFSQTDITNNASYSTEKTGTATVNTSKINGTTVTDTATLLSTQIIFKTQNVIYWGPLKSDCTAGGYYAGFYNQGAAPNCSPIGSPFPWAMLGDGQGGPSYNSLTLSSNLSAGKTVTNTAYSNGNDSLVGTLTLSSPTVGSTITITKSANITLKYANSTYTCTGPLTITSDMLGQTLWVDCCSTTLLYNTDTTSAAGNYPVTGTIKTSATNPNPCP